MSWGGLLLTCREFPIGTLVCFFRKIPYRDFFRKTQTKVPKGNKKTKVPKGIPLGIISRTIKSFFRKRSQ